MNFKKYIIGCSFTFIIISCQGPEGKVGPSGKNSLIKITLEVSGINCPYGGQKIETGIDEDANGQLSVNEISDTKYVCNGKNSLIDVTSDPTTTNCSNGGLKIETGIDLNGNNLLEINEIAQTKFICNGINGLSNLTIYSNDTDGNSCPNGGFKINSGLDINSNLILDSSEINMTKYLCLPGSDKQVRIDVGESNVGTNSTDWYNTPFKTYRLIKFNKLNYTNIDSITFVGSLYTPDVSNKVYVQLYNWTDNVEIGNSILISNVDDWIFKESRNLYNQLPDKEIILGIRVKSEYSNYSVSTGIRSYIFIYKH